MILTKRTVVIKCVINIYEFMNISGLITGMVKWAATSEGLANRALGTGMGSESHRVVGLFWENGGNGEESTFLSNEAARGESSRKFSVQEVRV